MSELSQVTAAVAKMVIAKKRAPKPEKPSSTSDDEAGWQIAVIDRSHPDGFIAADKWPKVVSMVCGMILDILDEYPGKAPKMRDAGFRDGVKILSVWDKRTVALYKVAISRVGEAWPGAKLEVVELCDIPKRTGVKAERI